MLAHESKTDFNRNGHQMPINLKQDMQYTLLKTLLFMSLSSVWTFVLFILFSTVLMAGNGSAQNVKEVLITLSLESATIQEAFGEIESQTVFTFLYNRSIVEQLNKRLVLQYDSASVEQVLVDISTQTGAQFRQAGHTIAADFPEETKIEPIVDILQETVYGQVVDTEIGEGLPGVTILIKNNDGGTATGLNGDFSLVVPSLNDTLIFSSVGYQTQEIPLNGRSELHVYMQPELRKQLPKRLSK